MKSTSYLYYYVVGLIALILVITLLLCSGSVSEMFSSEKQVEYYSLSTCPHCVEFNPVWKQFEEKSQQCKKYVVDKDDVARTQSEKYQIYSYPTIIVTENGKQVDELQDRTCGGLRDMCKKHGIPCTVVC